VNDGTAYIVKCRSTSGSSDSNIDIIGWTTGAYNYIKIWTDPEESYRHSGIWDDTKYRIIGSGAGVVIYLRESYIYLDGIQIEVKNGNIVGVDAFEPYAYISNNIIRGENVEQTTISVGTRTESGPNRYTYYWNNIIYNFTNSTGGYGMYNASNPTEVYYYNNTVYGCKYNFGYGRSGIVYKNNISSNSITYNWVYSYLPSPTSTHNLSSDTTIPPFNTYYTEKVVGFVDENNNDFRLAYTDTEAKEKGTDLSLDAALPITEDIAGTTRPIDASWDLGAFESTSGMTSTSTSSSTSTTTSTSSSTSTTSTTTTTP